MPIPRLALLAALLLPGYAVAKQPNIIVILSDDAGYADFGVTGCREFPTPHIDALAADGVFCSQGYVTGSTCTPSRMGMMSGRYQHRFGAECNVPTIPTPGYTKEDLGLDTGERTLANAMKDQGYRTMAIGKWHLGELPKYHPNQRGFDEFFGFLGGSRSYWPLENAGHGAAIRRNDERVDEKQDLRYLTDDFTDAALDFIDRNREQPFFLYLAYNAVHTPMHAKEEDMEQYSGIEPVKRRTLAAMTRSMDLNIGRVLARLEKHQLKENTLVFFLNDNGGATNNASVNRPLRGFKGSFWEGGIRVPFVVSWPAELPRGRTFDHPVSSLDLLPTCVAAAGGTVPEDWQADGVDLLPSLKGDRAEAPHERLFWRLWRVAAVRQGPWKLVRVAENPLKTERNNLLPTILINLEKDPGETVNVAEQYPEVTRELLDALGGWESQLAPPRWYDGSNWKHWAEVSVKNHRME